MKRIEIIIDSAAEEDLMAKLREHKIDHYTRLVGARGRGLSEPKMGDSIWPRENSLFIVYCESSGQSKIVKILTELKKQYPVAGIKAFSTEAAADLLPAETESIPLLKC